MTPTVPAAVAMPANIKVVAISAGAYSNMVLTSTGQVLAWGPNDYPQLGNGSHGLPNAVPTRVDTASGTVVTAIAAGWYSSLAVTSTGGGPGWGFDSNGAVGDGKPAALFVTSPQPVDLPPDVKLATASAGTYHSAALTTDGRVLTWGYGLEGQLGNGTTGTFNNTPVFAALPAGLYAASIEAGGSNVFAVSGPQPITTRKSNDPVVEAHERLAELQPPSEVLRCVKSAAAILDVYREGDKVRVVGRGTRIRRQDRRHPLPGQRRDRRTGNGRRRQPVYGDRSPAPGEPTGQRYNPVYRRDVRHRVTADQALAALEHHLHHARRRHHHGQGQR
jgi:hypothetical protein